jgi:sigma-E factor negative regulatory protein RseA
MVTEQSKELLSAFMDGEASEIEHHRLLRQMADDDSLMDVWVSYHETRRAIRQPLAHSAMSLNGQQHRELHHRISSAISEDDSYDSESSDKVASIARPVLTSSSSAFAFKPASALAIAASLVVAVFVGTQLPSYEDAGESANGLAIQSSQSATTAIPVQTVSTLSANSSLVTEFASGNEPMSENSELMELDEERQKRLRAYLNEHERMSRFRSNQQLVTYPDPSRP